MGMTPGVRMIRRPDSWARGPYSGPSHWLVSCLVERPRARAAGAAAAAVTQ